MIKVLVIDADSNFASALGRAIVNEGNEARIVGDAKYGIVRAKAFEPDLVLIDTNLPGVEGVALITELKSLVSGRIVVCAESDNPEVVKAAIAAGASDYVVKSSGIEAIIARTCKSDDEEHPGEAENSAETADAESAEDTGEAGEDDGDGDNAEDGSVAKKTVPVGLRAPTKEGKRPFCVVVAHPDDEKRAYISEIVERLNSSVRVIETKKSIDTITACAENRTVLLVIDWDMPEIPAKQVMRSIHDSKHGSTISMFVTYKGHSPEKQRVAEFAGAMAFAGEPWDDGSLEGQLKHTLEVIRKRRRKAKIRALQAKAAAA